MTPRTLAILLASAALLAGCNYNTANDGQRAGPQAVHPSPSPLAQGGTDAVAADPITTCGDLGEAPCAATAPYTPAANDGSQPIID